jgi:hypothetical protein
VNDAWRLVIQDMDQRRDHGAREYNQTLDTDDQRYDWLQEAYEELLDLCVYMRAELERRTDYKRGSFALQHDHDLE